MRTFLDQVRYDAYGLCDVRNFLRITILCVYGPSPHLLTLGIVHRAWWKAKEMKEGSLKLKDWLLQFLVIVYWRHFCWQFKGSYMKLTNFKVRSTVLFDLNLRCPFWKKGHSFAGEYPQFTTLCYKMYILLSELLSTLLFLFKKNCLICLAWNAEVTFRVSLV